MHLIGILFPHINNNAQSKSHQIPICSLMISNHLVYFGYGVIPGRQKKKISLV